jgi:hypothetical protein
MRELHATAVVRAGQPIQLEAHGAPGDIVGLRLSQATRFEYEPQFNGVGLTAQVPTGRLVRLGTIPTSGRLSVQLPSVLAVGTLSQTFHLQSLHRNPQGMFTLGSLRELVIVDPAY